MIGRLKRHAGAAAAVTLLLSACSDDDQSRADVVAAITTEAVPSRFGQFAEAAVVLDEKATQWCGSGRSEPLLASVESVRAEWVSLLPFWFGPVMERRSRFIIDPAVTERDVVQLLDATEPIEASSLRDLYGADQRGLAAIEQLVDLVDGSQPTDRECDYATASAGLVAEEAAALSVEWAVVGPQLGGDETAANESIESMINEILFGIVGLANDPDIASASSKLEGMRWAILGDATPAGDRTGGLSSLLDAAVVEQLVADFDAADELDVDAVNAVEVTITTNVVSALGLSVQFSDADGDG